MKKIYILSLLFLSIASFGQVPQLIPYQAIARDAAGQPLVNVDINARFTIHDETATGTAVWQEIQTVVTSALGLFTVQLGSSVPLIAVNWANGYKFMQVEIDFGAGFIDIGTQQLLSVPYALYSGNAANGISSISLTGDTLYLSNGNYVIVPGISDANGSEYVYGCTDNLACNFIGTATMNDGSCVYPGALCNDGNTNTLNDVFNSDCVCEGNTIVLDAPHSCGAINVHNANLTYGSMTDQDGKIYKTIVIGTQEWMAENLKASHYRNGDLIAEITDSASWVGLTSGACCWYNNDSATYDCPYGKLYNWYAAADSRNVCPSGWHIPSDAEWNILIGYLDPNFDPSASGWQSLIAGGKMKSTGTQYWLSPNAAADNSSGFSGLPGGASIGQTRGVGSSVTWWSSTQVGNSHARYRDLLFTTGTVRRDYDLKYVGYSVRCLKD